MRIVSWNMGYWSFAGFKKSANRQRQWSYLMALAPDVALLQECRPSDLGDHLPPWAANEYVVLGEIPPEWQACSAVLARRGLMPRFVHWSDADGVDEAARRWFTFLAGYVARSELTIPGIGPVRVASVHAVAREVSDETALSLDEHAALCRPSDTRAWHNDLAAAALRGWVGERFVVGGDWNTARAFDERFPEWGPCGREFFDRMASWGWSETLRHDYPEETGTYIKPTSYPYELDHLFTDRILDARLARVQVMRAVPLDEMSDHAPIVADYDLTGP